MFIQVIQGRTSDPQFLREQLERWRAEVKPGATGYLGSTSGVTADGRSIAIVRFESEERAVANSQRPEQGAWWAEARKAFDGEPTFHDCRDVDLAMGGGSDQAGFVQVMQGRAKDQEAMRQLLPDMEPQLREQRPDVLGATIAWHGDGGGFTQAVYFRSEQEARANESAASDDGGMDPFLALLDGELTYLDLTAPDLD